MEKDIELRDWLECHGRPYVVVATKIDKLKSQKERHQSLRALRKDMPERFSNARPSPAGE